MLGQRVSAAEELAVGMVGVEPGEAGVVGDEDGERSAGAVATGRGIRPGDQRDDGGELGGDQRGDRRGHGGGVGVGHGSILPERRRGRDGDGRVTLEVGHPPVLPSHR